MSEQVRLNHSADDVDQMRKDWAESFHFDAPADLPGLLDDYDALHAEAEALQRQVTELTNQRDAILLQARCWAGEAKAQQAITMAVGEALGGVPNWGPIAAGVEALRAENAKLRTALAEQGERQEVWARQCDLDESDPALFVSRERVEESGYTVRLTTATQPSQDVRALVEAAQQADDVLSAIVRNDQPIETLKREYGEEWSSAIDTVRASLVTQIAAHRQAQSQA